VRWTAVPVVVLLSLMASPASAVAGYDIAHIVKRTCEPGGPLLVAHRWTQDLGGELTKPGEVIACPPAGRSAWFQLAAGPERFGGDAMLCTYFSLRGLDGADLCDYTRGPRVKPFMAIQTDRPDRLELAGIVSAEVASVAVDPSAGRGTLIPIGRQRAARLGATRAFAYFSLPVDRRALCAGELRVVARDSSGRRIADSAIPSTIRLLSAADRVPHSRSLDGEFCEAPATSTWLTETLTLVLKWLI
jgi:hypothetical protein